MVIFFIRMIIPRLLKALIKAKETGMKVIIPALINNGISRMASGVQFL